MLADACLGASVVLVGCVEVFGWLFFGGIVSSGALLQVIGRVADRQWGLVTTAQAREVGVSAAQLRYLADEGALLRVRHGVYSLSWSGVSPEMRLRAEWLALVPGLLCEERLRLAERSAVQSARGARGVDDLSGGVAGGDVLGGGVAGGDVLGGGAVGVDALGGVVSHVSAAFVWGLVDLAEEPVHLSVAGRRQSRRPEVCLHRAVVGCSEWTRASWLGVPVTVPERTLADLLANPKMVGLAVRFWQHASGAGLFSREIDVEALARHLTLARSR